MKTNLLKKFFRTIIMLALCVNLATQTIVPIHENTINCLSIPPQHPYDNENDQLF